MPKKDQCSEFVLDKSLGIVALQINTALFKLQKKKKQKLVVKQSVEMTESVEM